MNTDNKKKTSRWYVYVMGVLIVLVGFVLALPMFLSSSSGTTLLNSKLSYYLKAQVTIKKLHLGWFSSQYVEGFEYNNPSSEEFFSFQHLKAEDSLWNLLLHYKAHQLVDIQSPVLHMKNVKKETATKARSHKKRHQKHSSFVLLAENISIHDAEISLQTPSQSIQFKSVDLQLKMSKNKSFALAKGKTYFNDAVGSFNIDTSFSRDAIYKANINATNFPICGFDELLHLEGLLIEAIGPVLNAEIKCALTQDECSLSMELLSANFKTSFHTTTLEKSVSLVKPASLSLTLTPSLFQKARDLLGLEKPLCMTRDGILQMTLEALNIPYENQLLNFKHLSYKGKILSSPLAVLFCDKSEPVSINSLNITSSTKDLGSVIDFSMQSSFNYLLKNPSYINTNFKINDLFSTRSCSDFNIDIVKFPLVFLSTIVAIDPFLIDLLGDAITLKASSVHEGYKVYFDSPRLQIPELSISVGDTIAVKQPTNFAYTPSEDFIATYLPAESIKISRLSPIQGTLESFNFHLKDVAHLKPNNFNFLLKLRSDSIALSFSSCKGLLTLKETSFSIIGDNFDHFSVETETMVTYASEASGYSSFFNEPVKVNTSAIVDLKQPKYLEIPSLECKFENSKVKGLASAAVQDNLTKLVFLKPLEIELIPPSDVMNALIHPSSALMNYVFAFPVKMSCNMSPIYLNQPLIECLAFDAQVGLERFDLMNKASFEEFSFLNTKALMQVNAKKKQFLCNIQSNPVTKGSEGGLAMCQISSKEFNSFDLWKDNTQVTLSCKAIPSSLADTLLGFKEALKIILGSTFESNITIICKESGSFVKSGVLSPNVEFSGEFSVSKTALELQTPLELIIKLTEESHGAFEELFGKSGDNDNFELTSPSLLHVTTKKLYWPLNQSLSGKTPLKERIPQIVGHLNNSFFHIIAKTNHMVVQSNINGELTALDDFVLECSKNNEQSPLVFNLNSRVKDETKDSSNETGHITAVMTLQTTQDKQNRPMLLSKLDAKLSHFPTMLFDSFFQMIGFKTLPPSLFLGKQINATLVTDLENLSGSIDFEVNSTDCKGNLNAYLTDGVVKLYKPIHATMNLSSKLADVFLKNMNFHLSVAKNPIELFISDKGFYFPLDPFDLKKFQIRQASLNLGQIICTNYGNPFQLSGVFKLSLDHHNQTAFWFAPMEFSISNGYLSMDRTEVLFNNAYQIAFWGRINIVQKVVDMILGITEQSLRKAFGIRGLPRSFVLQIPMGGPIGNVKISTDVATARIAILIAKSSGIDQGGLWGGIVNALSDMANDQESVPAAKPPFPWQDALSKYEEEEARSKTVNIIK